MARKSDTRFFENMLLDFVTAKDPLLEMLQWVMDKFMETEVAHKSGAEKGSHSQTRTGYRCGYRIRRFDTRLGAVLYSFVHRAMAMIQKKVESKCSALQTLPFWSIILVPHSHTAFALYNECATGDEPFLHRASSSSCRTAR